MSGATRRLGELRARPARALLAIAALVLIGATAFGLWHLVVGGVVNGNPRAGTFGLVLALAASTPLLIGAAWLRLSRSRRRADRP